MPTYVESAPMARPGLTMTRVSWGAILAGVVIAFAVEIMVALLGAGIGLSLVDPGAADAPGAGSVGIGALAWWAIGTIIALVAGSYAAVRAAGLSRPVEGTVHGLSIWAATLLITLYLMTSAVGGILGGAFRTIGSLAGAAGSGVSAVAPTVSQSAGLDPDAIKTRVEALLAQAPADPGQMTPEAASKAVIAAIPAVLKGGEAGQTAENHIADIVAAQAHVSHDEAMKRIDQTRQDLVSAKNDAVDTARSAAAMTAHIAARTSVVAFIVMLLGAIAAGWAGSAAARRTQRAA
jgi:hypothetical protein